MSAHAYFHTAINKNSQNHNEHISVSKNLKQDLKDA